MSSSHVKLTFTPVTFPASTASSIKQGNGDFPTAMTGSVSSLAAHRLSMWEQALSIALSDRIAFRCPSRGALASSSIIRDI
ncbi:uncharacterized protein BO80DRAFT_426782 [Aspergillus ibericus CBS 121593]|uniref:Uncharacterized protein n=1 Tax=Aspergillus ibericus CBS 121593 TaxID=1448316 RepID=A0A395GVT8_9EURO|nr:hypothetical protein BO80DRAFT_426782 [Aspergillus ibericus CBS 121593]RAK99244.1 hypothetical protein BO80DRAFT_426782 [Aspergillus ibericus CBS 121593]